MIAVSLRLRSPLGLGLVAAVVIYGGFLAWPSSGWIDRVGGAIDWVGGALLIVGPILAAVVADLTRSARLDVRERIPQTEPQPWGSRLTFAFPVLAFVCVHVVVLGVAVIVALAGGARDTSLVPLVFRQLSALAMFGALGYLPALWWDWRGMVPGVAIGVFAIESALLAIGHGFLVSAGGSPLVSSWHRTTWATVGAQIIVWLAVAFAAAGVDLRTRRPRWSSVAAGTVALFVIVLAMPSSAHDTPLHHASQGAVRCDGAQPVEVCLAPGSERWHDAVAGAATEVYGHLDDLGVATPHQVVDVGGTLARAYETAPGDLDSAHALTLASTRPPDGVPLSLIDELVVDPRCATEAAYVPEPALAWLYAQMGDDVFPDLTVQLLAQPEHRAWRAQVFTIALECGDDAYPPLGQ